MTTTEKITYEVEYGVVGALLNSRLNSDARDVLTWLKPEMFATFNLGAIYAAIQRQALQDNLIDILLLSSNYGQDLAMLADITRQSFSAANLLGYAEKLRQIYQRREAQKIFLSVASELNNTPSNKLDEVTTKGLLLLNKLLARGGKVEPVDVTSLLGNYLDKLEEKASPDYESNLLFTGINGLDSKLGGIGETDICIIAGRAGNGKTETAITLTRNIIERGDTVLFFSLEMSNEQILERLIASRSGISSVKLRNPKWLTTPDYGSIETAIRGLKDQKLFIVDKSGLTMDDIIAISEKHIERYGKPKAIVIDYIGLVRHGALDGKINRTYQIGESMEKLKTFTKDNHVAIILLAQLSRNAEGAKPSNADLRDSGSLEQDASQIIMVHNQRDKETGKPNQYTELIVTKNRHGETGVTYVEFNQGQFIECDQEVAKKSLQALKPQQKQSTKSYGALQ